MAAGLLCHVSFRDDILAEEANNQDVHIFIDIGNLKTKETSTWTLLDAIEIS